MQFIISSRQQMWLTIVKFYFSSQMLHHVFLITNAMTFIAPSNILYIIISLTAHGCIFTHRESSVQIRRTEIQSFRLLSLLCAPSSCLIKACIINPTIFESFFLSLCRYDCYIKGKLFCSNSHLMFLS